LIYSDLGLTKTVSTLCDQILAQSEAAPAFWQLPDLVYSIQSRLHLFNGDLSAAQISIQKSQVDVGHVGIAHATLITPLLHCELAFAQAAYDQVVSRADQFITMLKRSGIRVGIADAYFYKGQALLAKGEIEAAYQALTQAYAIASDLGTSRIVWRILATLAEVENERGNEELATKLRHEARTTLEYIIEHIPEGELRASFVTLLEVKRLLADTT
jgi:tetratricopeptide (TPR) repeat protein